MKQFLTSAQQLHDGEDAQMSPLLLLLCFSLLFLVSLVINAGKETNRKIEVQNAVDAASSSGATHLARGMNLSANNNVAMAQLISTIIIVKAMEPAIEAGKTSVKVQMAGAAVLYAFSTVSGGSSASVAKMWADQLCRERRVLNRLEKFLGEEGTIQEAVDGAMIPLVGIMDKLNLAIYGFSAVLADRASKRIGNENRAKWTRLYPNPPLMPVERMHYKGTEDRESMKWYVQDTQLVENHRYLYLFNLLTTPLNSIPMVATYESSFNDWVQNFEKKAAAAISGSMSDYFSVDPLLLRDTEFATSFVGLGRSETTTRVLPERFGGSSDQSPESLAQVEIINPQEPRNMFSPQWHAHLVPIEEEVIDQRMKNRWKDFGSLTSLIEERLTAGKKKKSSQSTIEKILTNLFEGFRDRFGLGKYIDILNDIKSIGKLIGGLLTQGYCNPTKVSAFLKSMKEKGKDGFLTSAKERLKKAMSNSKKQVGEDKQSDIVNKIKNLVDRSGIARDRTEVKNAVQRVKRLNKTDLSDLYGNENWSQQEENR